VAKFAFIGVGSAVFGAGTIADIFFHRDQLAGSTLALVDTDPKRLELMASFTLRMNDAHGNPFVVESSIDRQEMLPGSDFVITSAAIKREELWKQDWDIIRKAGIKQTYGENAGPGSLLLTLRNVPMLLAIYRDVERLAPDAWIINYTNPEARVCMALSRYTDLKFVGLCHQIWAGYRIISRLLDVPTDDLDIKAGGINHCTWMYSVHRKSTREDLYPAIRNHVANGGIKEAPLSSKMCEVCGLFPTPGDHHLAEMLSFGWEYQGLDGRDFGAWGRTKAEWTEWLGGVADGSREIEEKIAGLSGERVAQMAVGLLHNTNSYEISMDVRNDGAISNLPDDAIVEVPGLISSHGIVPLRMPQLPESVAGFLRKQITVQELSVEAAVTGSRTTALQALLLDPVVDNVSAAEEVLANGLEANREYVSPRFFE